MKCSKCGYNLAGDDLFCPDCGTKVKIKEEKKTEVKSQQPKIIVQQLQKSSGITKIIGLILIVIVIIFLFKTCNKSDSGTVPSVEFEEEQQSYEPEPTPQKVEEKPQVDKSTACSKVSAEITDACWSCGIVSCGLVVTVKNTGSEPILKFNTITYVTPQEKHESSEWDPLDIGAERKYHPYAQDTDIRLIEFTPIVLIGNQEFTCESNIASYGNAYGDYFPKCEGSY